MGAFPSCDHASNKTRRLVIRISCDAIRSHASVCMWASDAVVWAFLNGSHLLFVG
jgi:hypothetical protein